MADDDRGVAFDGGSPRTRKQVLFQLNDRLKMEPGVRYTRFEPSRIVPDTIVASVVPTEFLGEDYPSQRATLEVWWSPRPGSADHFTVQWIETPDRHADLDEATDETLPGDYTLSCGFHGDDHFDELGEAHFQEEYPDGSVERYGVSFGDATPRWVLSECLRQLPGRLSAFREELDVPG